MFQSPEIMSGLGSATETYKLLAILPMSEQDSSHQATMLAFPRCNPPPQKKACCLATNKILMTVLVSHRLQNPEVRITAFKSKEVKDNSDRKIVSLHVDLHCAYVDTMPRNLLHTI